MADKANKGIHWGKTAIAVLLAGLFLAGIRFIGTAKEVEKNAGKEEAVPVSVCRAKVSEMNNRLSLVGDLRSLQEVNVYPKIAGRVIQKIHVEKGDWVVEGQLLVSLEKDAILAQVAQIEASMRAAESKVMEVEANLRLMEKDRERFKRLFEEGAIARQRFEYVDTQLSALQSSLKAAKSQADSLKASLELHKVLLKDHNITAPMSGYISNRYVDEGTLSDTKVPILRISYDNTLKVFTNVTEKDFPYIRRQMEVLVNVDAFPDRSFKGYVDVINPTIDPATRTGHLEIKVENPELLLRSGMFSRITLDLGKRSCLSVKRDALNRMQGTGTYFVFTVENEKAILKNVRVGLLEEDTAEILEGLKEGDLVVTRGQNRLRDGTKVKVTS